ncbi:MAG: TlpA disulfide reductase family protein [Elusimicrobiota bacterium]
MKKKFLALFIILSFSLVSCKKTEHSSETSANSSPESSSQVQSPSSAVSDKKEPVKEYVKNANYFSLPSADGGKIDLKDYSGRPVLVMFFTENCPYCRKAAPYMEKMHKKYSGKGLAVIGISLKDSSEGAKRFASDLKLTFPLAYKGSEIGKNYHVQGVPFIYLLDKNHNNYDTWMGYDESYNGDIDVTIEQVLK